MWLWLMRSWVGKGGMGKRDKAELLAKEKAMGPLLGFIKSAEMGAREEAKEQERSKEMIG